jgi:cysteinyl-tRNA synthetase
MSCRELGFPFDIHGGGWDLQFPHHENEIAQSEGATGAKFVNYWMHAAFLNIDHEKMSKSLGNFHTVQEILDRGYRPSALRYLLLSSHYRKQLNFTWAGMDQAEEAIGRIMNCLTRLESATGEGESASLAGAIATARAGFTAALESDLNTAGALGAVFDFVRDVNAAIDAKDIGRADADAARHAIDEFDCVLGVVTLRRGEDAQPPVPVDEIERLIDERKAARTRRDFAAADGIRNALAERGILLEDNAGGTRWKRK